MKTEILRMLRNSEEYVSGQELSEKLGISRTAVWKNIRSLKEEGYQIEAVQNRGYRILKIPDSIRPSEIKSRLGGSRMGCEIYYIEETSSTNIWAKRLGDEGAPSGTLAIAQQQTQGRGRRGRQWLSFEGDNIYMSLLLRPDIHPEKAPMLTLVMGLSVAQGINRELGVKTGIKWPNDVILGNKKAAGILTEMSTQSDYIEYLVIGVGINCNSVKFSEELSPTATSLAAETGETVSRAQIVAAILRCFEENYEKYIAAGDLSDLLDEYNENLVHRDQEIRILEAGREYTGTARGIDAEGHLLVETADQKTVKVFTGEVSVRGMQGYVN